MTSNEERPADWYPDPAKIGELRYFDGTQWTEHVTISGVQTTAPFELPEPLESTDELSHEAEPVAAAAVDPASAASFTVTRSAQRRSEEEKALDVASAAGRLGRFVTMVDGAPGYRFEDAGGTTVLTVSKPSLKNTVEVADQAGQQLGSISKIGRLHSRYDIARADTREVATVKLVPGALDEWTLQLGDAHSATINRTSSSPADSIDLANVQYGVTVTGTIDPHLRRLLLAVPLAIDILDTQAV